MHGGVHRYDGIVDVHKYYFLHYPEVQTFSTSPSADLDSSEICHRLTQAEYRLEVAMYQLISLERCSRLATVASEENEREPYDRKVPQAPQADHWPRTAEELPLELRGGACSAQIQAEALH